METNNRVRPVHGFVSPRSRSFWAPIILFLKLYRHAVRPEGEFGSPSGGDHVHDHPVLILYRGKRTATANRLRWLDDLIITVKVLQFFQIKDLTGQIRRDHTALDIPQKPAGLEGEEIVLPFVGQGP